jgi:uncharacterized protein (DUF2147 family)
MTINRRNSWFRTSLLALPLVFSALTAHAADNALTGNWARNDGAVRMAIVQCGGNFCATNTWVKDPNGSEKVGDELVMTLQPASSSVLQGQAYDVRRKATYKITVTLEGGTGLQTSGCILLGIVCKSAQWTRTK